jgi:hypothetical protein
MPGPKTSQLDHWLDEELDSLVHDFEADGDAEEVPAQHGASRAVGRQLALGRVSRRALARLSLRRSKVAFYAFAVAAALTVGWLIPFLDKP